MSGNEGFYIDERGLKADADIHHPILDAKDDFLFRQESFLEAVKLGISVEDAAKMYGMDGAFDLGAGALG